MASQGQHGFGVAGGEGGHVAEHQVAGAVAAEGTLVGVADDGEGVEYVGGLVAVQAVQVEVQRVEAGDAVAAVFGVPDEGFAVVRSEEHTSELQSLMPISYSGFLLQKTNKITQFLY